MNKSSSDRIPLRWQSSGEAVDDARKRIHDDDDEEFGLDDSNNYSNSNDDDGGLARQSIGSRKSGLRRQRSSTLLVKAPLLLFAILIFVLLSVVFLALFTNAPPNNTDTPGDGRKDPDKSLPKLTPELYARNAFGGASVTPPSWVSESASGFPDGSYISHDSGSFYIVHLENANRTLLANSADFKDSQNQRIMYVSWSVSPDLKYMLLVTDREKGWRNSFYANYWLFDVDTKRAHPLAASKSDKQIPDEIGSGKTAIAAFGSTGHSVGWVRDNDLYVTISEETEVRITTDGSKNTINGIADWVYEEEVLAQSRAFWFSPDQSRIAFLKFNETLVKDYMLQYYAKYGESQYPKQLDVKYPKPGSPNPIVTLHIATPTADSNGLSVEVDFGDQGFASDDRIIGQVTWVTANDTLLVRVFNRVQDLQKLFMITGSEQNGTVFWTSTLVRSEQTPDGAWHNNLRPLTYLPPSQAVGRKNPSYLEIMDDPNGYAHLAYFSNIAQKEPTTWITSGAWEVSEIVGLDHDQGIVYFLSTEQGSMERHLYSVHLDGSSKQKLTPPKDIKYRTLVPMLNQTIGRPVGDVGWFQPAFSPGCRYYMLGYLGPDIPFISLYKTGSDWNREISNFSDYRQLMQKYALPQTMYTTIKNTLGDDMNAKIIVPSDFDPSGAVKYPVLFQVYGGPTSQTTQQIFRLDFPLSMALYGFIVVQVDGRGTGFKGRKFRSSVSRHLGLHEVEDQVEAAKWIVRQGFADEKRIAIWGWSYGGYMAAKTIEANTGVFAVGMAVAPVIDWRYYNTIYSERYMKTPARNPDGFSTSAVKDMTGFHKSKFLLIHGTADDNVHVQNSAVLVWRLTGSGVPSSQFRVSYYTDSDHGIYDNGANEQVFDLLKSYVCSAFGVPLHLGK